MAEKNQIKTIEKHWKYHNTTLSENNVFGTEVGHFLKSQHTVYDNDGKAELNNIER